MGLSKQVLAELMTEKKRLAEMKRTIDERLVAINRLLSTFTPHSEQLEMIPSGREAREDPLSRVGLREAIRRVLQEHPEGLRARDLEGAVTERGYTGGGKTPLRAQISNELWRMEKKGELEKAGRATYRMRGSRDGKS